MLTYDSAGADDTDNMFRFRHPTRVQRAHVSRVLPGTSVVHLSDDRRRRRHRCASTNIAYTRAADTCWLHRYASTDIISELKLGAQKSHGIRGGQR